MSRFADHSIAQSLALQVRLYACQARLSSATDPEALHDLRIALRKLRSLLKPLRGLPAVDSLEQAAAAVGRLSGPLRDREVLLAELRRQGHEQVLLGGQAAVAEGHAAVAASRELNELLQLLDAWPARWRQAAEQGQLRGIDKRIRRRLRRQWQRLAEALRDPAHDRHRVRLLIKRVRYGNDAYPQHSALPAAVQRRLKVAQGALGNWHDNLQWLAQAEADPALQVCHEAWRAAMVQAQLKADEALLMLLGDFPRGE